MRRIFIGDIQGCAAALDRLLGALGLRPGDRVICVGDLVNRGPDSLAVLRRLAGCGAEAVLGNHDLYLLRSSQGLRALPASSPLAAVLDAPDASTLLAWLAMQPIIFVDPDIVAVHAGLHPEWNDIEAIGNDLNDAAHDPARRFSDPRIGFATQVRYCDERGNRPQSDHPSPRPPFQPWDAFYRGSRTVVFGHWARRGLVIQPKRRGLDTGCVYGGPLTAWIAEEDRLVQVPGRSSAP